MTKRRKFSREFKLKVIRELENGTDIAKICRKYNIYKSLPGKWKQEFNKDPRTAFTGKKIVDILLKVFL